MTRLCDAKLNCPKSKTTFSAYRIGKILVMQNFYKTGLWGWFVRTVRLSVLEMSQESWNTTTKKEVRFSVCASPAFSETTWPCHEDWKKISYLLLLSNIARLSLNFRGRARTSKFFLKQKIRKPGCRSQRARSNWKLKQFGFDYI